MEDFELSDHNCYNIMEWLLVGGKAYNTLEQYRYTLKKLQRDYGVLNNENLRKILKDLKHQNQKAVLTAINNYCFEKGIDFHLVMPKIKVKPRKIPDIYSLEEIKLMIDSSPHPYDLAIRCLFNMGAGLRISEVIKLTWNTIRWVDWIENQDKYGVALIKASKGSKERVVNIPSNLMKDLYKYAQEKNVLNEFRIPVGGNIFIMGKEDYKKELRRENEEKWKNRYIRYAYFWFRYNILKKRCEKALGKKLKLHSLRHCVSEDTQILTVDGWKNYSNIKKGEKIYSYNINEDKIEKDIVKEINVFQFNDYTYNLKNGHIDLLCTPEHKSVFNINKSKGTWEGFKLNTIEDILKTKSVRMLKHKTSSFYNGEYSIGIPKASLLGWILTDGTIQKNGEISISQSLSANPHKCKIIEDALMKSNIKYSKRIQKPRMNSFNGRVCQMVNFNILKNTSNGNRSGIIPAHEWIYKYITKKRLPKYNILNLKQEELKAVYEAMMLGDGSKGSELCSQNEYKLEFFRTLCSFIGKTAITNLGQHNRKPIGEMKFRTYITDKGDINILLNKHLKKYNYSGIMWCPTTNNGTWIAQRNGRIFITGNSRATYLYEIEKVPIEKIQTLLGHAKIDTTMLYTKINPVGIFESIKNTKEL